MKNLTIRTKLIILSVFIVTVLLVIEGLVYCCVNKINRLNGLVKSVDEVAILSLKMRKAEKDFFTREVKNENFFKTNQSEYFNLLKGLNKQALDNLKILGSDRSIIEFGLSEEITSCSKNIDSYYLTFSNIAGAVYEKGYKDYGIIGKMNKNISQLDYYIDQSEFNNRILNLRYVENGYFMYGDVKYQSELNKQVSSLIAFVNDSKKNSETVKQHVVESLAEYSENFNKIVELDKKIGFSEKEGLMLEMRDAVHLIEPSIENIQARIKVSVDDYTSKALIYLLTIIFIIMIVTAISIRYIIKYINTKMLLAQDSVKAIAEGDFSNDLEISNHDEIGNLLTDVQKMTLKLRKSVFIAHQVSKGDLMVFSDILDSNLKGELDLALKEMVDSLTHITEDILNGASTISSASEQISSTAQGMSQGASEQAASSEEISSSMEQIVSSIEQTAENSQNTEKISIRAANEITETNIAVTETLEAMRLIAAKISIINEIANKTDLLALNAGIEAARAGEHGKGFAIVAVEVRKLAENSRKSSHEIIELVNNCLQKAEKSNTLLTGLVPEIGKTARLVQEISASSQEQNLGVVQINSAITQLNQVTQQNASSSEELATSAEELSSQAEHFLQSISFFNIGRSSKSSSNRLKSVMAYQKEPEKIRKVAMKERGVTLKMEDKSNDDNDYKFF
jgi:methyl-accepting chemotaxis protein